MNKKYLKKISDYTVVGGLGAVLVLGLTGCEDRSQGQNQGQNAAFTNASQKQGAFVIIEKNSNGAYAIADEFPATKTTIVLRENGQERILSKAEIDALVAQENVKIDNGTSRLTNPDQAQMSNGGLGLGEVLLSSIAGAMIGSYIGNKLFNNSNYKSQRKSSYKNPSTYSRSVNSFNKAKSTSSSAKSTSGKSGFFGSGSKSSSSSRSFFGG